MFFEIRGTVNTAICYASEAEEAAIAQIRKMCDCPMSEGSRIRIMPDMHAGAGCTIGTTMTITDKVVPNVVGVDIGCGMYTVKLKERDIPFGLFDDAAHSIPSGFHVWQEAQESFDLTALNCASELHDLPRLERSLGTLGGGNHFIEIDAAQDGTKYLVIHSGSRNLGKQVAEYYQQRAVAMIRDNSEYQRLKEDLIRRYTEEGRARELESTLKQFSQSRGSEEIPPELSWLSGTVLEAYLQDVEICQAFARRNRELMAQRLLQASGLTGESGFHTIHNYIDTSEMILRKGAIAAHTGELVLIPLNMRDGSILAEGKGNAEWNYSAPHGAGRIMSRSQARKRLSLNAYKDAMQGIYSTSVNSSTLDESPMAYKPVQDILGVIHKTVDILELLKPVYNFKASD